MVVGSKGWAERRYIREVKDVQRSSDTSRILKDIQEAFSRSNTEGRTKRLQSQRRRFYASSACRGAITVRIQSQRRRFYASSACRGAITARIHSQRRRLYASSACRGAITAPTVATSEVLRFECLSRCNYSAYSRNVGGSTLRVPVEVLVHGAYSRNVGGSTLRVPVEVQLQCIQSQRRRFYASSACRGAITVPTVATSEVLRFECLSRCNYSAYSRNVGGSTLRVPVEVLFHGAYLRNVGGSTLRV